MKALVLFQEVQGICKAAKSANVAASAELWRYQPRHQKLQSDSVLCPLLSALNAFVIDSGDLEGGVLNQHKLRGFLDATILLLVNYILAAYAAAKVSHVSFTVGVQALTASAAAAAAAAAPTDPASGVPCQPGLGSAVLSLSLSFICMYAHTHTF